MKRFVIDPKEPIKSLLNAAGTNGKPLTGMALSRLRGCTQPTVVSAQQTGPGVTVRSLVEYAAACGATVTITVDWPTAEEHATLGGKRASAGRR